MKLEVGDYVHLMYVGTEYCGTITEIIIGHTIEDHGFVEVLIDKKYTKRGCKTVEKYTEHFVYYGIDKIIVKHIKGGRL